MKAKENHIREKQVSSLAATNRAMLKYTYLCWCVGVSVVVMCGSLSANNVKVIVSMLPALNTAV